MLREQREHEIQLVILREADNDIRLRHALLEQEIDIRAIAADGDTVPELFRHALAALVLLVDDLHLDALPVEHRRERAPRPPRADDHHAVDAPRVALHEILAELLDLLRNADEIRIVMRQQIIVAMRDDHAVIAEDHPREHPRRQLDIAELLPRERRAPPHARLEQPHLPMREILDIERRRRHEDAVDLRRRDELRVQHEVDIEILLEILLGLAHELHIADARDRMRDAVLLREDAGDHVHLVARRHRDEDIRAADVRLVHRDGARAVRVDREHIERILRPLELRGILVDHDDIERLLRQKLRNAVPELPCPDNDNPHHDHSFPRIRMIPSIR